MKLTAITISSRIKQPVYLKLGRKVNVNSTVLGMCGRMNIEFKGAISLYHQTVKN